jgi:23S rRNA (pseudouridine1915-N3)-methyltransferase
LRLRLITVGKRMPEWVDAAFEDYRRRLRAPWALALTEVTAAPRRAGDDAVVRAKAAEADAILAQLTARDAVICLDEHGNELTTLELVRWLREQQVSGQDLAFIIGGADGLHERVLARAQLRWSLSRLTFAHGLCRVVLIEQLYRAICVINGHPYHRG